MIQNRSHEYQIIAKTQKIEVYMKINKILLLYDYYYLILYAIWILDLILAIIGYTWGLKLLDTHIRSSEGTVLGWMATLVCYGCFAQILKSILKVPKTSYILFYNIYISSFIILCILILHFIYFLSTCMFGMRFSNLTNRGIITKGPYRIVRHPAYATKILTFWCMGFPLLFTKGATIFVFSMILWTIIYIIRAYTEERHLRKDNDYLAYSEKVRWMFIPHLW